MGRVALVTGAGKRIGRAIATRLGELGYDLALHYYSSEAGVLELKEEFGAIVRVELLQKDLRESFSARDLIAEVATRFGRLDLLINNASTYPAGDRIEARHSMVNETEEEFDEALTVNLKAPFFLMKYAYPLMRCAEGATIINILDLSAESPMRSRAAHTVSKGGLLNATKLAAASLDGVRVVGLLLGHILPGEDMPNAEMRRFKWVGVEPVLAKIEWIVSGGAENGEICWVT